MSLSENGIAEGSAAGSFRIRTLEIPARPLAPALYLVATPIGNLGDITLRALETLAGAGVIAAEDTRVTRVLLDRYGIAKRAFAYHEHNSAEAGPRLISAIASGKSVALVSDAGTPVIVNSSDAVELQGLCDKVVVLSRGHVVETVTGDDVTEERIVAAAVKAETHGVESTSKAKTARAGGLRHFLQSDNAPAAPLALVTVLLGLYVYGQNENFLSVYNVYNIFLLATALGFIALGQTVALLMGGIDLSVGPLAGFLVVVASFFVNDGQSGAVILAGFVLMFVGALITGAVNGILIRYANFTPIAATLAMYIAIQGLSFLLRDNPDGYINSDVTDWINWQWGPFPVAFLVLVAVALGAEFVLRRTKAGWRLRAVGSDEEAARRIGTRVDLVFIAGYVASSLLTALGAVMLMTQIGVGDPRQGVSYTLSSITAVVLGGTSLTGGRGTFIGTVLGAVLLTEVLSAITFLSLTQTYQYLFQGILIVVAALIYSAVRRRSA